MEMKFLQGVNSPEYGGQLSRNMHKIQVVRRTQFESCVGLYRQGP